jgi:hypothetical protein
MTTVTRTTTGAPSRASPGSATKTVVTKTVAVTPGRTTPQAESRIQAAPRVTPLESRAAAPIKPHQASKPANKPVAAKSSKPALHAEGDTASRTTTDHDSIRRWAEKRGGHPTSVTGTEHGKEAAGVLRLDFGVKDEKLHPVDWQAFFDKFEESNLAFLYQDKTSNGKISRFHKFIHRH